MKILYRILTSVLSFILVFSLASCGLFESFQMPGSEETTAEKTDKETNVENDTTVSADTTDKESEDTTAAADTTDAQSEDTTVTDDTTEAQSEEVTETEKVPLEENKVPEEYAGVINDYKKMVEFRLSDEFDGVWTDEITPIIDIYKYGEMQGDLGIALTELVDFINDPSKDSFGYVISDINSDGTPELLWTVSDPNIIVAVFTVSLGRAQLVDAFWSRYRCNVTKDGQLLTMGSNGASYTVFSVKELEKNSTKLTTVAEFGTDFDVEKQLDLYYEIIDGKTEYIDRDRFDELASQYPFENDVTIDKDTYYPLYDSTDTSKTDEYYLTLLSDENIIAVSVPEIETDIGDKIDKLISDFIVSRFTDYLGISELELTRTDKLSDEFQSRFESYDYTGYYVDLTGRVSLNDDGVISLIFEGMSNYSTAAHPNHLFWTLNIDAVIGERVFFNDVYIVNDDVYDKFLGYAQAVIDSIMGEDVSVKVDESMCTRESFLENIIDETGVCVYYTETAIGFSYETPHAFMGHQEVEIPVGEFEEFKK